VEPGRREKVRKRKNGRVEIGLTLLGGTIREQRRKMEMKELDSSFYTCPLCWR